jgi:hypothetical protein
LESHDAVQHISIFLPLVIFLVTTFATLMIHGFAVQTNVYLLSRELGLGRAGVTFWTDVAIVAGTMIIALIAHLIEITIWGLVFISCGEFSQLGAAFYHSATNYTSLGYGDLIMSSSWKLLGPLETADGMLMFGVSTAMIIAVLQRLIVIRFGNLDS